MNVKRSLETISSNPTTTFGTSEANELQEPQNKLAKPGANHQCPNSWSAVFPLRRDVETLVRIDLDDHCQGVLSIVNKYTVCPFKGLTIYLESHNIHINC